MKMKKILVVLAAAALAVSMSACTSGSNTQSSSSAPAESSVTSTEQSKTDDSKTESSEEESKADADLSQILERVKAEVTFPCETQDLVAKKLSRTYGIEENQYDDFTGLYCIDGVNQEQFTLIKAKTDEDVEDIKEKLQNSLDQLYNVIKNYTPEQVEMIENSKVETKDKYVYLIISTSADTIRGIINDVI